ncbi:MAG: anhydro-N-acetylmuramic acid kinase [Candidatus Riflebacteria bacterium]|nr:anhydro-N-acetylmuramic acid kinase [Candidatus Riflebacteria bacterium]
MQFFKEFQNKKINILGMMSGTSGDGIDGALVEFLPNGCYQLVWGDHYDFSREIVNRLKKIMNSGNADDLTLAGSYVAELYVEAVAQFKKNHPEGVDFVAAHGQTLWHSPESKEMDGRIVRGSFQAFNSSWFAEKSGICVISDFRARDLAVEGQGAPLVPFADLRFFGALPGDTAALNVGGIANFTIIRHTSKAFVECAYDSGPANMLMDLLAFRISKGSCNFDKDGKMAAKGKTDEKLLKKLMEEEYFFRKPPKSTGREKFSEDYFNEIVRSNPTLMEFDLMSTLLDFTVNSIVDSLERFVLPTGALKRLIIAGGGALNTEFVRRLREKMRRSCEIFFSDDFGVPVLLREAMAFAALGEAFIRGVPSNVPAATGAKKEVILGVFTPC